MPLKFATRKKLDTSFEINFFAQVELLRLLQKGKKLNSGNASVVALSSVGGTSRYDLGNGVYGATKAALLSWMKTAAVELGPSNIRVNCICPGSTKTPMTTFAQLSEEQVNNYLNSIPLRRMGEPEEIAYGAVYLLSDAARWVTGTSLIIDGGISL
jgi:NAD(P)-dependent dehydrogenase (short-subunit alcohol dehydrogenase family)